MLTGWANFAWQADYGQFYLIDLEDLAFEAPTSFTEEMETRRVIALSSGLVVYTNDCLQQHVRLHLHDAEPALEPAESMSGNPWTQVETLSAKFPSRAFSLSSPSSPTPLPGGPIFLLDAPTVGVRVYWMEFQGSRDDSVPVDPDVIEIHFWPQ